MRTLISCFCLIFILQEGLFGQNNYAWEGHNISFSSPEQLQVKSNNDQDFKAAGNKITVSLSVAGGMDGVDGLEGSLQSYVESFYQKSLSAADISNQGSNLLGATVMAENMNTRYLVGLFCQTNYTNHFFCEIAYLKGNEQLANEVMTSLKSGNVPANKTADKQDNTNRNQANAGIDKGQMKELPVSPGTVPDNNKKPVEVWNKQKIVLYGNPECGNTIYTRDMLDKENIEYSFFNVIDNEINDNEMYSYLRKYGFIYKIVYPVGYFDSSFYNKLDESWVSSIVDCFKAGQEVVIIGDGSEISRNLKASLDKTKIEYEYMDKSEIDNCEEEIIKGITSVNQVWYPVTVINDTLVINGSHNFTEDIIAIARSAGSSMVDPEKRKQNGNQPDQVENGEPKEMAGMVDRHNYWRSKVGVAPLVWSGQLAAYAQKWADELAKQDCDLIHSSGTTFGENLFGGSGTTFTAQDAVDAWASELDVFVYEPFTGRRGDGHYTQMVWENTTKVGCAKATCPGGKEVWVCEYSPSGNYINEYPYKKKK